jgi:biopolymer transport protein ExbB
MIEVASRVMINAGPGWVLWVLIALSVASATVAIERAWLLRRKGRRLEETAQKLHRMLENGEITEAQEWLSASATVEGAVAAAGLSVHTHGPKAAAEAMAAARGLERARLERRLGLLGTVGNNAPFVGLLGTVIGVVGAFAGLASAGGDTGSALAPEKVMSSIAEALVATAVGLLVAIPVVAVFNYLQGRITVVLEGAETLGHVVLTYLEGDSEIATPGVKLASPRVSVHVAGARAAEES